MTNLVNKMNSLNRRMSNKVKDKHSDLMNMEKVYNDALKKGLVNKPKYDIPDPLKMVMIFRKDILRK